MSRLMEAFDRLEARFEAMAEGHVEAVRAEGGVKQFSGDEMLAETRAVLITGTDLTPDELIEAGDRLMVNQMPALAATWAIAGQADPVEWAASLMRQAYEAGIALGLEASKGSA